MPESPVARSNRSNSKERKEASESSLDPSATSNSQATVVVVMTLYMGVSVSTTLMNKWAFPKEGSWKFPYPFSVSCFQMVVALLWLVLLTLMQQSALRGSRTALRIVRVFGVSEKAPLRWRTDEILSSAGAAGAFTGMLSAGNLCLLFVQVSFYQAAKSQHILCNLLIAYFAYGNSQPGRIVACCAGVTIGFLINALAEQKVLESMSESPDFMSELIKGCAAGFVSSFFVALYPILLNRSFLKGADTWQKSINVNTMSIVWYLPLMAYEVFAGDMLSSATLRNPHFWTFNFLTGTVGFLLNVVAMLHVRYTSPLTHMIVGSLKGAVTTLISVLLLGDKINSQGVLGLGLLIASSFAYSYFRSNPSK